MANEASREPTLTSMNSVETVTPETAPARLNASGNPAHVRDIVIERCTNAERSSWDAFVAGRPDGCFYHLFDWKEVNERSFSHTTFQLAARSGGRIVGVLPLVLVESRLFGRILCSTPFVNFGGPCSPDPNVRLALAQSAIDTANELAVDYLELRCASPLPDADLAVSLRKISMTIELTPDPDTLWNGFTSKHRKNVKRAYKDGLSVTKGGAELLPDFYSVLEESWRNLGTPLYRREYFERVLATFPENTTIYLCRHSSGVVGASFVGHFNGVVEGMWAGGRAAARKLDANYVLYWEMIKDACLRGFSRFHLGRSTADSGAEDFKRKWNAQPQQLYWYFHVPGGGSTPALNVDNPKYRLAIAAWRRLPLWTTRVLGARLAPFIP